MRIILASMIFVGALTGCRPKIVEPELPKSVAMQSVAISSIPLGAEVYADGQKVGTTPTAVILEKNRDHQITVAKEGFSPQNITVTRKRDPGQTLAKAFASTFDYEGKFNNPVAAAEFAYRAEEQTGECSVLEPAIISVQLIAGK